MTAPSTAPVVHREITVPTTVDRAYALFTERFDAVKPRHHNLLAVPIAASVLEAEVGGRVYDRGDDGTECTWGRVLEVDAPHRLVFSWLIGPTWELETDPANASEVEVRFTAAEPGRTRVELEHRHLDRHGPGWDSLVTSLGGGEGWPLYLERYEALTTSV